VYPKFPDWPPGARTANGTALCHYLQLYRCFVSQSSEFCRHNPLRCFLTSVYFCCRLFRYRLSLDTFGYTLVWNTKFHYRVHKGPSTVSIQGQMHPVHTSRPVSVKSILILSSHLRPFYSEWSLPFRFSGQNFLTIFHFSHACYMPHSSHPT